MSDLTGNGAAAITDDALVDFYGADFLEYGLGLRDPSEIDPKDTVRLGIRETLATVCGGDPLEPLEANRRFRAIWLLCLPQPNGYSLAQALHILAGGAIAPISSSDPLVAALSRLAQAIFPLLSIPRPDDWPGISSVLSVAANAHPSYPACLEALRSDPALAELFKGDVRSLPNGDADLYGITFSGVWSSGIGGGTQLVSAPMSALEYAYVTARLSPGGDTDPVVAIESTVALMRKLASRSRVRVPVVVGLGNLEIPPGVVVPLGRGHLMNAEPLRGLTMALDAMTPSVMVLHTDLALLDVLDPPRDEHEDLDDPGGLFRRMEHRRPTIDAASRALDREIVRGRLAIALSSEQGQEYAPAVDVRWIPNPFLHAGGGWSRGIAAVNVAPRRNLIDHAVQERTSEWFERLSDLPESMWLGARRLVAAVADRSDPLDSFVDAVVCWENLLGAETEVSFRLCAGMARLLEPADPTARRALYESLRSLYGVRSGLVHGSREPSREKAKEHRDLAIAIACRAMRAIFDRPDLLEAQNAGERNHRIMLGA